MDLRNPATDQNEYFFQKGVLFLKNDHRPENVPFEIQTRNIFLSFV